MGCIKCEVIFEWALRLLDLSGCIITIDAMETQKKIAQVIMTQNNDYILALKENHKTLYDDTSRFFENMIDMKKEGYVFDENTTVDGEHGRIEIRRHVMTSDIDWLTDAAIRHIALKRLNAAMDPDYLKEVLFG